jgi:hypothetical protein
MTSPHEEFGAFCATSMVIVNDAEYYAVVEEKRKSLGIEMCDFPRTVRQPAMTKRILDVREKLASHRKGREKRMRNKNKLHPRSFVKTIIADTEDFWRAMSKSGFVRVSVHEGWCGKTRYITRTPPEYVDGFIEGKMTETVKLLGKPPSGFSTFLLRFGHWTALGAVYSAFVYWLWN